MRSLKKIILVASAGIAVILIGGYIAVRAFLPPETVRRIAEQAVSKAVQYPVSIGRTDLHIGFGISIAVKDITVTNAKNFTPGSMVKIDRTALNISLLPLLRRRVVIRSIDLTRPLVNLERSTEGALNIAVLMPKPVQGADWAVALSRIRINGGEFNYRDRQTKREFRVSDIDQKVTFHRNEISIEGSQKISLPEIDALKKSDVTINNAVTYDTLSRDVSIKDLQITLEPIRLRIKGTVGNGERLDLAGTISIRDLSKMGDVLKEKYATLKIPGTMDCAFRIAGTTKSPSVSDIALKASVGKTKIDVTGNVEDLAAKEPRIDLSAQVNGDLNDLATIIAAAGDLKMSGLFAVKAAAKGRINDLRYSGDMNVRKGFIDGIGLGAPVTDLDVRGGFQGNSLKVSECRGNIGRSDFALTGTVSDLRKPVVTIDCRSKSIDLDELMPEQQGTDAGRSGGAPISIQGKLAVAKLKGMDMEFTDISTNFNYAAGVVDVKQCRARAYDGDVALNFHYDANKPEPYRLNTRMTSVNARALMQRFLKFDRVKGTLSSAVDLSGNGLDERSVRSNMSGVVDLRITNGEFENFGFLTGLLSWMGLKDQKTVPFREMNGGFRVDNGSATLDDWTLSSSIGDLLTRGSIGMNGAVDMQIAITLSKASSDKVKKYHGDWIFFTDKDGRTVIDVVATGKADGPQFRLDRERIQQRLGGKIKSEFKDKAKEKVQDLETKIKDVLKGLK